jgi:tRNA threonylcarbamoyladenosine biosynthesis protein TsaB
MVILASDTSTDIASVAVRKPDGEVVHVEMDVDRPHSETLLPAVEEVLALAGFLRRDVAAIAVGTGPGAFTGLRVGLATFKGWAIASHLPILPVPSLDALAFPSVREGKEVAVLADARKGEVYTCRYSGLDVHGLPVKQDETELIPLAEVLSRPDYTPRDGLWYIGTGVKLLFNTEGGIWPEGSVLYHARPQASDILYIGEIMMALGRSISPSTLVPEYIRPPDAKSQHSPGGVTES